MLFMLLFLQHKIYLHNHKNNKQKDNLSNSIIYSLIDSLIERQ